MPTVTSVDETERQPGPLLCVLGMHRSGTSAVTQLLHRLGAGVGPQLLAAMDGVNADGFWEDSRVVEWDEQLLAAHAARWYDWQPLAPADLGALSAIATAARRYFAEEYVAAPGSAPLPFVVKDPRMCRLLPFWEPLWREARFEMIPVVVLRHPYAVAKSLERRDRIPFEYGVLLWVVYTLDSVMHTGRGEAVAAAGNGYTPNAVSHSGVRPGIVIAFEEFCRQPLSLAHWLQSHCGIRWPLAEAQWAQTSSDVVKDHLRHHDDLLPEGVGAKALMAFAVAMYESLVAAAPALPDAARVDALNTGFKAVLGELEGEIAMLRRLSGELMALSAESVRIGTLHSEALRTILEKDEIIHVKNALIEERDSAIREKDKMLAERNQLLKDIACLRFWRVLSFVARRLARR